MKTSTKSATKKTAKIAIVMGSQSDWPVMIKAQKLLQNWGLEPYVEVLSAHRTPDKMQKFAKNAKKDGLQIIIAGAGGAAHLPGMIAAFTALPVIGVPINTTNLKGLDSLLSIAQMPKGIPVATVAIDNSENAALLAISILALRSKKLSDKLDAYRLEMKKLVKQMNTNIK